MWTVKEKGFGLYLRYRIKNIKHSRLCFLILVIEFVTRMNEEYLCNTCRIGKIRPIHFSLTQAIVNCDNADCESYLEKWPWECIVTRPILNSSDLSKYERDSTCSSDSSGVHSDIGSSSLSQYSLTDREVENLLHKACGNIQNRNCFKKEELSNKSFPPWESGYENHNQGSFVALDNNFTSSNEMSTPDKNIVADNILDNGFPTEADSHSNVKNFDFFEIFKETENDPFTENHHPSNSHLSTNLDNELDSWLNGFNSSTLAENHNEEHSNSKHLKNENVSNLNHSKSLIPSVHSAFSQVSPSKLESPFVDNLHILSGEKQKTEDDFDNTKAFVRPNNFMSPASSGFSDDFSFNGDISVLNNTFSLNESLSTINVFHQTNSNETKVNECEIKTDYDALSCKTKEGYDASSYETKAGYFAPSCETKTNYDALLFDTNANYDAPSCDTKANYTASCEGKANYDTPSYETEENYDAPSCETKANNDASSCDTKANYTPSCEGKPNYDTPSYKTEENYDAPSCETEANNDASSSEMKVDFNTPSCKPILDSETQSNEKEIDFETTTCEINTISEVSPCDIKESFEDSSLETKFDSDITFLKTESDLITSCEADMSENSCPEMNIDSNTLSLYENLMVLSSGYETKTKNSYNVANINSSNSSTSEIIDSLHTTSQPTNNHEIKKNEPHIDFFPSHVTSESKTEICRNETRCKGGLKEDPWSISEVYIDELNIEVVLCDPSSGRKSAQSESGNENSEEFRTASRLSSSNSVDVDVRPNSTTQEINQQTFSETGLMNDVAISPPVVDIYKPITLTPEVFESEFVSHVDAGVSYVNTGFANDSTSNLRHSVGYGVQDPQRDNTSSDTKLESNDKNSNVSSKYLSSILSNIDFDENFCLGNHGNEISLEESISINYLNFESDSEHPSIKDEPMQVTEFSGNSENELSFSGDDDTLEDSSRSGEDSDTDIPLVSIDDNDSLKLFIPNKKIKKEKAVCNNEFSIHNSFNLKDYSITWKRKRCYSQSLRENNIVIPQDTFQNVIDIQSSVSSDSTFYNVQKESFTLFNKLDNFGNLKKDPENFDRYGNQWGCSDENDLGSSLHDQFGVLEDILLSQEKCKSPPPPKKRKKRRQKRVKKLLKPEAFWDRVIVPPIDQDVTSLSEFDNAWAKPYSNLPSQTLKNKIMKSNFKKNKFTDTLRSLQKKPTAVPDVLDILRESGWAVTPCNPIINYNIPEHAKSPTIIPNALQSQYGNMGSDLVLWSLTDSQVSLPVKAQNKNLSTISNSNKMSTIVTSKNNFREKMSMKRKFSKSFNQTFSNINNFAEQDTFKKRKVNKTMKKAILEDKKIIANGLNSNCLKSFKTKEGLVYFQPSFQKESSLKLNEYVEDKLNSSGSSSDMCIELPDDLVAYEEAKKEGFNVSAPTQPKSIYIPPPTPPKFRPKPSTPPKFKPKPIKKLPKENLNPKPGTVVEESRIKAQNELTSIVSERPVKEVPNVVCMNIDGKLYIYHRKD